MFASLWQRLIGRARPPTTDALAPADRLLVINDMTLTPTQLQALDRLTAPRLLQSGHYWFDADSGDLGWVGSPTAYLNLYLPLATSAAALPRARRALLLQAGCLAS